MKQKFCILFFLLLVVIVGKSQSSDFDYCDSILSKRSLSQQDFQQLDTVLFSMNYYRSDTARLLYRRAISKAETNGFEDYAAHFEIWLADLVYELFEPDSALYYANQAAVRALEMGDSLMYARTANIRRNIYTAQNDFDTAFQICFEALGIFERYDDKVGRSITLRDIGSIMMQEEKYDEALEYCLKAVTDLEAVKYWYELTFTYQRVAIAYRNLGKFDLAHQYIRKAMHACRQLDGFRIEQGLAKKYWTRGYIFEAQEDFDQALMYYDSAQTFARQVGYPIDKWVSNAKGEIYLNQKNYSDALLEFQGALEVKIGQEKAQKTYDYYLPIYSNLVETYEGLGRYEEANELLRRITSAKDSIFRLESEKQVAELQTKYETVQKEAQIRQLKSDKIVQRRFLLMGSILLILLLLLAALLWRTNRFRAAVNRTLNIQKKEIEAKNEQNELLLREIHHRVKNNLQILSSLLNLQADYIKDESALSAITEGRNRVQSMAFIHQQLYSIDNVTAVNMQTYLADLCSHLSDSFSTEQKAIQISFDISVNLFDVETAIPLGLIVNELVTNSIKYAFKESEEGHIEVKLWKNDQEQLCLLVSDDGQGMNASEIERNEHSFGSDLIKILSQKLKGKIEIRSDQGYATLITFDRYQLVEGALGALV
jgi:two-component sensor histidine kinase